jgi:hypothetical protein
MKPNWKRWRWWSTKLMEVCFWVNASLCLFMLWAGFYPICLYCGFMAVFCWATSELTRELDK